jgi:hypothetical protein
MPDFVTFDEFYEKTAAAKYEHHRDILRSSAQRVAAASGLAAKDVVSDDSSEAEFEKMKAFLIRHYAGVEAKATFLDMAGNHFDCIPFDLVPTVRKTRAAGQKIQEKAPDPPQPAKPWSANPGEFGSKNVSIVPPLRRGLVDIYGNKIACPDGCVPLRRTNLDRLALSGRFERFFQKGSGGQFLGPKRKQAAGNAPIMASTAPPAQSASDHQYGIVQDMTAPSAGYAGAGSWLNIWDPSTGPSGMSLSQHWVTAGNTQIRKVDPNTNPQVLQTMEGGWMVQPVMGHAFQTGASVLFIYFNPDGYLEPNSGGKGGYLFNQDDFGFIPSPNVPWVIAGAFNNPSAEGGDQNGFWMWWTRDSGTGNWWLYLGTQPNDAIAIGYFPKDLFIPGQLANPATAIQFGGEVAPAFNSIPMGSGARSSGAPATDYRRVAFQNHVSVQVQGKSTLDPATLQVFPTGDDPPYNVTPGSSPNWGSFFFFGGGG